MKNEDAILVKAEEEYLQVLSSYLQKRYSEKSVHNCELTMRIHDVLGKNRVRKSRLDSNARESHVRLLEEEVSQDISSERKNEIFAKVRELEWDNCHY